MVIETGEHLMTARHPAPQGARPARTERVPVVRPKVPANADRKVRVVANPTDAHGVYADDDAWELALKCIELMDPDVITWGNDAMDLGIISTYTRLGPLPSVEAELKDERQRRLQLRQAARRAQIKWITGNHEVERYARYIHRAAPEMADLEQFSFAALIGFPAADIIEEYAAGDTLRIIHGAYVKKAPGASVLAHLLDDPLNRRGRVLRSVMMGHVHRFAYVSLDNGIEGLECGCLQQLRPEYLAKQRRGSNWTHGMGFARYGANWSQIIPARFTVLGNYLVCRLEGQEVRVKLSRHYSGL